MTHLFANWKMYLDAKESATLAERLADMESEVSDMSIVVFPNTLAFAAVQQALQKSDIGVGAQNVNWVPKGAYTGAVSALLFKEAGATHALVGHSERRYIFGENDEDVRKKIEACLDVQITPVVCIGETKEDRDEGKEEYRVKKQLMKAFDGLDAGGSVIVAYEPVWAISKGGVGEACDPIEVERMGMLIRSELKQYRDEETPIIYGGSVNEENVLSYLALDSIDGVLPGHASADIDRFVGIVNAIRSH